MARPDETARNLLFGLIALQNGLIDQGQLVAAFQAWTRDKAKTLAQHLAERGDLDENQRVPIELLVALHLARHGGDAEASLAGVPVGDSTRLRLAALADPGLTASLGHAPRPSDADTEPDRTATYSVGSSTSDGRRFRVLRPHARGGLGAVFVALDDELHREVALKEILDDYADDPGSRHRFLVEAQVTGGLEHPGIVPVYGLGSHGDGRPYYAMRFIRGDSLKDAIARFRGDGDGRSPVADPSKTLAFRNLLRRFTDVCNAIEYAHSRGVLHRDIKPGNISVGKYGETLVVDWGLAKPTGRSDPASDERTLRPSSGGGSGWETLPGGAIGTPAYMSPEQARGDLDALGPATDVYALGATLYTLLTGRAPFGGEDRGAVLRAVQAGDFPRPRRRDPAIDPALEAICLKAMATRPGDRYPSARALADDVDHWLADEPVAAYPDPPARRAGRWMRRHRTFVAAAAVALMLAVPGLAALSAVRARARDALAAKNAELTAANARIAGINADLARTNAALDLQRRRAEDREQQAIDAVKRFRDAVAENPALRTNPSLESLRKALLKEPLAFFKSLRDRLQADRDTRPESLASLASAAFELGNLTSMIGDELDAIGAYRESLEIRERLAAAHPDVPTYRRDLAASHNNLGYLLNKTGRADAARAAYESALALQQALADAHPDVPVYRRDLAISHHNLGALHNAAGRSAEARAAYESALAIRKALAEEHPDVPAYRGALATSHVSLGNLHADAGRSAEARAAYESALALQKSLAEAHPDVPVYRSDLAASHHNLGALHNAAGRSAEARAAYESALALQKALADAHPDVPEYLSALAASHNNLGLLHAAAGRSAEARAAYESALALQKALADAHPEVPEYASDLGMTLHNMATLDLDAGRLAAARAALLRAVEWQRKALAASPRHPTYRQFLAKHYGNLIRAARGLGREEEAASARRDLAALKASDPRFEAMDARLAAVAEGEPPRDVAERLALAERAYDLDRHALAARLWAEALEADPALAADRRARHRYNAACAAALAAAGSDADRPALDEAARAGLRRRARDWLSAELAVWARFVESGPPQVRAVVAQWLRYWKAAPNLAAIRDASALAALPDAEREACRALWSDVDGLLARAEGRPAELVIPDDPFAR